MYLNLLHGGGFFFLFSHSLHELLMNLRLLTTTPYSHDRYSHFSARMKGNGYN